MANITFLGASYTDVPAVTLPQTGGGTVTFYEGGGGTPAISVVDTLDSHGGTIREITALDISDTTAVASDVAQGKYFYTAQGVKTPGTASGGGGTPSATAHTIYFEFSDNTNTTITAYWDDSFISSAITATTPTTYGQKTVTLAQLDGVTWYSYTPTPSGDWTTIYDGSITVSSRSFELASVTDTFALGDTWRATLDGTAYTLVVQHSDQFQTNYIGNMAIIVDWASTGDPILCYNNTGHIAGNTYLADGTHTLKLEKQTSA